MTLHEHLTALSEKATGGEWSFCRNPENTRWIIDSEPNRAVLCTAGYEPDSQANAALITTLVNAWRDGQLVTREEHERVSEAAKFALEIITDSWGSDQMESGDDQAANILRAALNGSN